jgi:hypothetical protein
MVPEPGYGVDLVWEEKGTRSRSRIDSKQCKDEIPETLTLEVKLKRPACGGYLPGTYLAATTAAGVASTCAERTNRWKSRAYRTSAAGGARGKAAGTVTEPLDGGALTLG